MSALLLPSEILSMPAQAVRLLVESGDGDAALLYLALLESGGDADRAAACLHWQDARLRSAWERLAALGLAQPPEHFSTSPPAPAPRREGAEVEAPLPEYSREELTAAQEREPAFRDLCRELEGMLGRVFTDHDLKCLYTIYDHLALPPEVIVLLTSWTIRRERRLKNNPAACPRMPAVQREAFKWKRLGVDTLEQADAYLRRQEGVDQREWAVLQAVGVTDYRPAVEKERAYIAAWVEMGLSDDLIRLAYERTVYRKKAMNWPYMNKILQSWHSAGYRTVQQAEQGDRPPRQTGSVPPQPQSFQPSPDRIRKSNDKLDKFWAKQKKGEG